MEFLILGLAIGGVVGAKGKQLTKPLARAYLGLAEKSSQVAHRTRIWNASLREELQEVVEEARREHAEAVARRLETAEGAADPVPTEPEAVVGAEAAARTGPKGAATARRGNAAAAEAPAAGPDKKPVSPARPQTKTPARRPSRSRAGPQTKTPVPRPSGSRAGAASGQTASE
jgi:hypothetical protein